jgi:hypothetical protein
MEPVEYDVMTRCRREGETGFLDPKGRPQTHHQTIQTRVHLVDETSE